MMQFDVTEVSLVASCRSREEARLIQQMMVACGLSAYNIQQDLRAAIDAMASKRPDTALFVADKEDAAMRGFFKRARATDFKGNRYIPIIVALWHPSVIQIKTAIELGANEILSLPSNTEAMRRAIYRAVFVGRPFIDVPTYFGPCRRRKQIPDYGTNRRQTEWEYSHILVRQTASG